MSPGNEDARRKRVNEWLVCGLITQCEWNRFMDINCPDDCEGCEDEDESDR